MLPIIDTLLTPYVIALDPLGMPFFLQTGSLSVEEGREGEFLASGHRSSSVAPWPL